MRYTWLGALAALLVSAVAWAAEPVAYITELRRAGGDIRVRDANGSEWKAAQPLRPLHPGDQVRVTGEARAVLLYRAGGATQTVAAATSPFTVPAAVPPPPTEKLRVAASGLTEFFVGKQAPPTFRKAATRSGPREGELPAIVGPRQTRVYPGSLTFEWEGSERVTYGVRLSGPDGVVWAQERLAGHALPYPATAPALRAGVRYVWQLDAPGSTPQRASFEILSDAEVARVRQRLEALPRAGEPGYSRNTTLVMRVGTLFEEGLYDAAWREAEAAVKADPDEPTLHVLLGHIYQQIGLSARAALAFERARALTPDS